MSTATFHPIPKAPLWVEADRNYLLRHVVFGEFRGRCVCPHSDCAIFLILDDSPQLLESGYKAGQQIELAKTFTRAQRVANTTLRQVCK